MDGHRQTIVSGNLLNGENDKCTKENNGCIFFNLVTRDIKSHSEIYKRKDRPYLSQHVEYCYRILRLPTQTHVDGTLLRELERFGFYYSSD